MATCFLTRTLYDYEHLYIKLMTAASRSQEGLSEEPSNVITRYIFGSKTSSTLLSLQSYGASAKKGSIKYC